MTMSDADWWSLLRELDEPVAPVGHGLSPELLLRAMVEGSLPQSVRAASNERVEPFAGDGLEVPRHFDLAATQGRFDRLAERLSEAYGCRCDVWLAQDSACFGSIWIPSEVSRSRTKRTRIPLSLTVSVSNFGGLAACGSSAPWGHKPHLHPDDRARIEEALDGLDYLLVPEHILSAPYDGPNGWVFGSTNDATWSVRFFEPF
ncbi:hypothetical protein OOJ91_06240 [Micromonospora lupini]|uniref:hypothetical protein n=1 Tax=Micromonospora lupini TaxID=285679 RepID=UPI00224DECB4|nr:hypothetical protein [Micromonospora lupini]MCX5065476.1 hypothetical protein [Micromonospora lupini]